MPTLCPDDRAEAGGAGGALETQSVSLCDQTFHCDCTTIGAKSGIVSMLSLQNRHIAGVPVDFCVCCLSGVYSCALCASL